LHASIIFTSVTSSESHHQVVCRNGESAKMSSIDLGDWITALAPQCEQLIEHLLMYLGEDAAWTVVFVDLTNQHALYEFFPSVCLLERTLITPESSFESIRYE